MAVTYDGIGRVFRVTLKGSVDTAQCVQMVAAMLAHPQFKPGIAAIWDARDADLSAMNFQDFQNFRAYQSDHAADRGRARIALVANSDLGFGMGRMAAQVTSLPHLDVCVFRDLATAEKWVLESPFP